MPDDADQQKGAIEVDKLREDARRAKADADAAEAAAAAAKRQEAEASSPAALARRAAVADKDAVAARRDQLAALVPDLSSVSRGDLTLAQGGQPAGGTAVGGRALHDAASAVAAAVVGRIDTDGSVLVTSDDELAASDAAYHDVMLALEHLIRLAEDVLASTPAEVPPVAATPESLEVAAAAAAVGKAVPGVLSLLSAHRTVTTGTLDVDDLAASAAIAGALKSASANSKVFHDSVRLVAQNGGVYDALEALRRRRADLVRRRVELEARTPAQDVDELAQSIALVRSVSDSIDAFVTMLTTVPDGTTRSPLTAAALRQGLHDGTFGFVLLVKAQSASGMQLVNDKPLWMKDTFSVIAAASITWLLLDARDGGVVDGGVTTGTTQLNGKIGRSLEFQG